MLKKISQSFLVATLLVFASYGHAFANQKFKNWLNDFYSVAAQNGISKQTYSRVFKGINAPDPRVLERANYQPEFNTKIWDYIDAKVNPYSINEGLKKKQQHEAVLQALEDHFGVDKHVLMAIWSVESNYGAIFENKDKLF